MKVMRRLLSPRCLVVVALAATVALLNVDLSTAITSASGTATSSASDEVTASEETTMDSGTGSGSLDCETDIMGDGECDSFLNTADCDYDRGDCCSCTCDLSNCGGSYNCIDPDASCVDDDDGSGGVAAGDDVQDDDVTSDMSLDSTEEDDADATGTTDSDSAIGTFGSSRATVTGVGAVAAIVIAFFSL